MASLEEKSNIAVGHFAAVRADSFGAWFQKDFWPGQPDALYWGKVVKIAQSADSFKNTTRAWLTFHRDPLAKVYAYTIEAIVDFEVAPKPTEYQDNPYVRSLGSPAAAPSTQADSSKGPRRKRKPANLADFTSGSDDASSTAESADSSDDGSQPGKSKPKPSRGPSKKANSASQAGSSSQPSLPKRTFKTANKTLPVATNVGL